MPDTGRTAEEAAWRLQDIAGHLSVAGLPARLHHTSHSTYLTAATPAWRGEIEATLDDDCYCEIRFWLRPTVAPAQAAAIITRTMNVIHLDEATGELPPSLDIANN